jgi:hypothetical protein
MWKLSRYSNVRRAVGSPRQMTRPPFSTSQHRSIFIMKVISQTEITSPEELILEVSDLLKAEDGSIWSIELEPDEGDECCGSTSFVG